MKKWEYAFIKIGGDIGEGLNKAGEDGWEVVCLFNQDEDGGIVFIVKKEKSLIEKAPDGFDPTKHKIQLVT